MKQEMMGWQWHLLDDMCFLNVSSDTSTQDDDHSGTTHLPEC